jgi:hypothetical protein
MYIDVERFKAAGGELLERADILRSSSTLPLERQTQLEFPTQKWKRYQVNEAEVLLKGAIPKSAIRTTAAVAARGVSRAVGVGGMIMTGYDLTVAGNDSIKSRSAAPITAEVVRQTGGWASAWVGMKGGAALGGFLGLETGPGAVVTAGIGAVVGGVVGYWGFDIAADTFIHEN